MMLQLIIRKPNIQIVIYDDYMKPKGHLLKSPTGH